MTASKTGQTAWVATQYLGLLATMGLLAGLMLYPEPSLRILWYAVISVLPAVFLLHPALWRNVCPLATLNMLPGGRSKGLKIDATTARYATIVGLFLLALLVPARRFVFNTNGPLLAAVIVVVALLALALGFVYERKAGFCNAICPVLPVERLYGQGPLMAVENPRCPTCTLCTAKGCLDLVPARSAQQAVGRAEGRRWLFTAYGAFAAAFPGFVVAYYLIPDGTWADAGQIYLQIGAGAAASWALVGVLALPFRLEARAALPLLGALALALYYWYGAPGIADAWQFPFAFTSAVRVGALALVALYLYRNRSRRSA